MTVSNDFYSCPVASNRELDSINDNTNFSEVAQATRLTNSRTVKKISISKKILDKISCFFNKLASIFMRIITLATTAINYIDNKKEALLADIKKILENLKINHLSIKVANFKLIINKPIYNVNICAIQRCTCASVYQAVPYIPYLRE